MKSLIKKLSVLALTAVDIENAVSTAQVVVPDDYVGGFRLRMYWEEGYNWQESEGEKFWCLECEDNCEDGDKISKWRWRTPLLYAQFFYVLGKLIPLPHFHLNHRN